MVEKLLTPKIYQWVIYALFAVLSGVMGTVTTSLYSRLQAVEATLQVNVTRIGVLESSHQAIAERLRRIEDKVDRLLERRVP